MPETTEYLPPQDRLEDARVSENGHPRPDEPAFDELGPLDDLEPLASFAADAERPSRLAVIFVQHDRERHRGGLPALLGALSPLGAETTVVVVDNLHPGDWAHSVTANIHHVGGDNTHWEFSAFDKGVDWLTQRGVEVDVYAFATDALLAYGADFLELVDDRVIDCARRYSVCVGWIDSFMERCEVLGYSYDAWLRTSLVFVPARVLPFLQPLAPRLNEEDLFGDTPDMPFRPAAPVSENLRRLLLEWLTTGGSGADSEERLGHAWHSQFALDDETFVHFKSKAKAILREHLLSARLKALGVGCYDLRAVRRAGELSLTEAAMRGESAAEWQWLGWMRLASEPAAGSSSAGLAWASGDPGSLERVANDADDSRPTFLVAAPEDAGEAEAAVRYFERDVMPLVLQRHASARLAANGVGDLAGGEPAGAAAASPLAPAAPIVPLPVDGEDPPSGAVALLLPPGAAPSDATRLAAAWRLPVVGPGLTAGGRPAVDGHHCLRAERPWEYAAACCRLIEESELRESLARAIAELSNGDLGDGS